jgi:hypothetical protein
MTGGAWYLTPIEGRGVLKRPKNRHLSHFGPRGNPPSHSGAQPSRSGAQLRPSDAQLRPSGAQLSHHYKPPAVWGA